MIITDVLIIYAIIVIIIEYKDEILEQNNPNGTYKIEIEMKK